MDIRDSKKAAHQRMVELRKRHPERKFKLLEIVDYCLAGVGHVCGYEVGVRYAKRCCWFDSYEIVK